MTSHYGVLSRSILSPLKNNLTPNGTVVGVPSASSRTKDNFNWNNKKNSKVIFVEIFV